MRWKRLIPRIVVWSSLSLFFVATLFIIRDIESHAPEIGVAESSVSCTGVLANDFQCYKKHFTLIAMSLGPRSALSNLKTKYDHNPFVVSQCHQLAHVIGNVAAETSEDISDAFVYGDSICWSGYYHGVVERFAQMKGREVFVNNADAMCAKITDKARFGFDYYNCVHGLGHGVMSITRNQLFDALALCKNLTGDWERRSCFGGAFMENVMVDNRGHGAAFLKPDDLLYPCNAVDTEFKEECYKMQTSYALTKNGYSFDKLFELCQGADVGYTRTCAQSIGRDASGQSVSNLTKTMEWCALARNDEQAADCYIGASKDFVSYFHSDLQARALCNAIPARLQLDCVSGLEQQWSTIKPAV